MARMDFIQGTPEDSPKQYLPLNVSNDLHWIADSLRHLEQRAFHETYQARASFVGMDIELDMSSFYGGQGSPQCTIVTRESREDGTRLERKMSWYQGDSSSGTDERGQFLAAGYFAEAIVPDISLPYFDVSYYDISSERRSYGQRSLSREERDLIETVRDITKVDTVLMKECAKGIIESAQVGRLTEDLYR